MNQNNFSYANSETHKQINDISKLTHNLVNAFFNGSAEIVNHVNSNLGSESKVRHESKIQPNYEIINETSETKNLYIIRLLVFLPGVPKDNITTKIINRNLFVSGITNLSDDDWSIEERTYEGTIKLPQFINDSNLSIKYKNGLLKVTIKQDLSTDINIE